MGGEEQCCHIIIMTIWTKVIFSVIAINAALQQKIMSTTYINPLTGNHTICQFVSVLKADHCWPMKKHFEHPTQLLVLCLLSFPGQS